MEYKTPKEMAAQWGISEQKVRRLCALGKVPWAERVGQVWSIPSDAHRPAEQDLMQQLPDLERIRFSHVGLADGLSQSAVNCILQDRRGMMWFGTQNGLNRYDGYEIKVFDQTRLGVGVSVIVVLLEDNAGGLWIASGSSLSRFDYAAETCEEYVYETDPEISFASNRIYSLCQDAHNPGFLWAATGHGLLRIETATGKMEQFDAKALRGSSQDFRSMQSDGQGILWLGAYGTGLLAFNTKTYAFERATVNIRNQKITALLRNVAGELIVGTDKEGIFCYDPEGRKLAAYGTQELQEHVTKVTITHLGMDPYGNLWVTSDNGAFVYSPDTSHLIVLRHDPFDSESLPSNWLRSLYFDPQGRIWLGSLTGGVSMYDPFKYKFSHIRGVFSQKGSLSHNVVRCFREDRFGHLWVGTERGLNRYDEATGQYIHYLHNPDDPYTINSNNVRGMYVDSKDRLWVFTWGGICFYDHGRDRFMRYSLPKNLGFAIRDTELVFYYEDSQGGVWVGSSDSGLVYHDPEQNTWELYGASAASPRRIAGDRQRFIFEDSDGVIFLSTMSGSSTIDRKQGLVINYGLGGREKEHPFARYFVLCRYEDDCSLWLGTHGGLFRKDKKAGEWTSYTVADGLPNTVVYGILPDEQGMLWMSTNRGITRFNPTTGRFRNFAMSDGLQSDEFNNSAFYKARNGEMFFGGVNGFNRFFPEDIKDSNEPVTLSFTGFLVSNEKLPRTYLIQRGGVLTVPYSARTFGLEFAAMEYSHPKKIQYSCMLEGFDEDWQQLGSIRSRAYRNVPPGHYVFRVRSTNKDGIWCKNAISIDVRIERPQWLLTLNPGDMVEERGSELAKYLEEIETRNLELQARNEALQNVNRNLVASVYHDALTGIYNRAGYKRFLDLYAADAYHPLGLMVLDVDGLKLVNDNLGHEEGDLLIQRAAQLLEKLEVDSAHIVARIGGDEFVVLIANCSRSLLEDLHNQLLSEQAAHNKCFPDQFMSLSSGYSMSDTTPREKLFAQADEAMYQYKQQHGEEARRKVLEYIARQSRLVGS